MFRDGAVVLGLGSRFKMGSSRKREGVCSCFASNLGRASEPMSCSKELNNE